MARPALDLRGLAAVVLAVGVVGAIVLGEVFAYLNKAKDVTVEEVATISTVLGAAVGAIATYLGTRRPPGPPGAPPAELSWWCVLSHTGSARNRAGPLRCPRLTAGARPGPAHPPGAPVPEGAGWGSTGV